MVRSQMCVLRNRLNFAASFAAVSVLAGAAFSDVEVVAIDFGMEPAPACGASPLFSGSFDGSSDFVAMTLTDCGTVESPALDLGNGVTFQFTDVSGWNNTDGVGPEAVQALTGDHFFSSGNGASDPVSFSVSGLASDDILILEFVDRRGGEQALVTFEGVQTLVSSDAEGEFTDVSGGGVTGLTTYGGVFTGPSGSGEGNLAGARITIVRPDVGGPCTGDFNGDGQVDGADFGSLLSAWGKCKNCPEDLDGNNFVDGSDLGSFLASWGECPGGGGPSGACCLGDVCWDLSAGDCAALGGLYEGNGTACAGVVCEPPSEGSCCEPGQVPGCIDAICANAVCLTLPDCCDVLWDAACAGLALDVCNDCDGTTDYNVFAVDFGQNPAPSCGESPLFTGSYDGSTGFVALNLSDCGAIESPSIDLGGVVLEFVDVSGWNNTDGFPANEVPALTGDHFFSGANGASDPVAFSVSGLDPTDTLVLEFLDRRGGETALVTFEGTTTLVSNESIGEFTDVSGGGVTGKSVYNGSFTGPEGTGEGNLAGARIIVIRDFGKSVTGACCLGDSCKQLPEGICNAVGGGYQGDGVACDAQICEPPSQGICCQANPEVGGCIDPRCANVVCLTLPECCEVSWDQSCADLALSECNGCDGTTNTVVAALDFGQNPGPSCGESPVYAGVFDGTTGFVGMTLSDCGVIESPSINVGDGVTLEFLNVSGWNNTDGVGPDATQALTGDHFFSSSLGASDPVIFQVAGMNCCDTLILEFVDRRGSEQALVNFAGIDTLVSSDELGVFTDVSGGGVTGASVYIGSFTGADGAGEGNLAGARLIIVPGEPSCDPSACGGGGGDGDCGTCNQVNPGPGCTDTACQDAVCAVDAFCCQIQWDSSCAAKATSGDYPECDC